MIQLSTLDRYRTAGPISICEVLLDHGSGLIRSRGSEWFQDTPCTIYYLFLIFFNSRGIYFYLRPFTLLKGIDRTFYIKIIPLNTFKHYKKFYEKKEASVY